jgi:hypothetical protein
LVPLFVLALTLVGPLLGREYGKYLLIFYVALIPLVLSRPLPKPRRAPLLYLYIAANALALLFHFGDAESILNAGSLLVSVVAIAGAAYYCASRHDNSVVDRSLEKWLWRSIGLTFCLSILLTAVGWPTAPDYFPWQAFYTDKRFLLINGDGVGHTPSLWVLAFLAAFTVHRLGTQRRYKAGLAMLLAVLVLMLLATKSRLALLYVLNLLLMGFAYKRVPFARVLLLVAPSAYSVVFLLLAVSPELGVGVNLAAQAAQREVGDWIRIVPREGSRATVFTGRDILNGALLPASMEKPVRGLGDGADILQYGVDQDGNIAYDPDHKRAGTESVLRLAVKYGWPYFAALVLFLGSIPFSLTKLPMREQILKMGIWGMCVESIVSEGGMENFYGTSGLFLFLLCLSLFQVSGRKRRRAFARERAYESSPMPANGSVRAAWAAIHGPNQ